MSEELDLDLENPDLEAAEEEKRNDRTKLRIKDLADKTKVAEEARAKAEADKDVALKEASFFKNFNPLVSKYPGASEFQEAIRERVMKGYDAEEATLAVLAKEGKYTPPPAPEPPKENPAGVSAATAVSAGGEKSLEEMSKDEKKSALKESLDKGEIRFGSL